MSGWVQIFPPVVGWVGLGQSGDGLGWIGSHKMDPWTTLRQTWQNGLVCVVSDVAVWISFNVFPPYLSHTDFGAIHQYAGQYAPPQISKIKIKNKPSISFVSICGGKVHFFTKHPPFHFLPTGLVWQMISRKPVTLQSSSIAAASAATYHAHPRVGRH